MADQPGMLPVTRLNEPTTAVDTAPATAAAPAPVPQGAAVDAIGASNKQLPPTPRPHVNNADVDVDPLTNINPTDNVISGTADAADVSTNTNASSTGPTTNGAAPTPTPAVNGHAPTQEPILTAQLPTHAHAVPSGSAAATAALTDADLPSTDNLIQTAGDINQGHEDGIEAVGWKKDHAAVPAPLIRKMDNEQLWMLIRRFDMVRALLSHPLLDCMGC